MACLANDRDPEEDGVVESHGLLLEGPLRVGDGHHEGERGERHLAEAPLGVAHLEGAGEEVHEAPEGHPGQLERARPAAPRGGGIAVGGARISRANFSPETVVCGVVVGVRACVPCARVCFRIVVVHVIMVVLVLIMY